MGLGGQRFQGFLERLGQFPPRRNPVTRRLELRFRRQFTVEQQIGDLPIAGLLGQVVDIVPAVM
jgi:hypothetical protein